MARYTYVNGKILPHEQAVVRVDDIGLSRAFGVYDGIMTYNGAPFELPAHYRRLSRSAKLLGLRVPVSEKQLRGIITTLVRKNSFKHPIVRVLLTGGTTLQGINFDPKHPTLIVLLEERKKLPQTAFTKGVRVITYEYERQIPEAKTINYIAAVRFQGALRKAKATEGIYVHDGQAFEATTSNFFIVKGKTIVTPKDGILNGITRQVALSLAKQAGYKIVERPISIRALFSADEVFLTSSFKEILPVSHIDGKRVKKSPGPVTEELARRFKAYTQGA